METTRREKVELKSYIKGASPLTVETRKIQMTITYPDINLPAINLWVLPPAWYFYATQEERTKYYEELLSSE
jgi:hypothetical protein